jgi:hypothetical protein
MATRSASGFGLRTESLTTLHWVGIAAALVSGVVHLVLGVQFVPSPIGVSFVLAGLGFFGAVVLVLADVARRTVYAVGIPFTAIQIVLWFAFNQEKILAGNLGAFDVVDKVAQVVLIAVLVVLLRRGE